MANGKNRIKRLALSAAVLALIAIISAALILWFRSTTVVLVIRHAERNDAASCSPPEAGPPLSQPAGENRAQVLAHVAGEARVAAIYASEFCRTQQTVQPLATQLGLPVTVVDQVSPSGAADVDALIAQVRSHNFGQVVLIAGHTNTVPAIIEKLGGGVIAPIEDSEFDNLFVLTIPTWGKTTVVRLKYGAP